MNCACYNIMNRFQTELGNLLSSVINNGINSGLPRTDDGVYHPNLNLLDHNNSSSFDTNTFFYICMILLAIITFSTMIGFRRRRIVGNTSTLH